MFIWGFTSTILFEVTLHENVLRKELDLYYFP